MRVVLLSEMYSPNMGYLENMFPKYLARLGVDVHVIATDLPTAYRLNGASRPGSGLEIGTVQEVAGYTLHILGHKEVAGYMRMVGLGKKLACLRPDIVQTLQAVGWIPFDAVLYKPGLQYKLFTGCHFHASVFPLAGKNLSPLSAERLWCSVSRTIPGRAVSWFTEKCYAITSDCADIAVRFFGVPRAKAAICPLGVDTELFRPAKDESDSQARAQLRQQLGFSEPDIVCIYAGRLSEEKNPLLLAKAVTRLRGEGYPFRGVFVGNGPQAEAISSQAGCRLHPFVPVDELGRFFRAAEVGVWPTQESLSMLDAAACGLPIVVNDTMSTPERTEGNGLIYRLNDLDDLVKKLRDLRDAELRQRLGSAGAAKMLQKFSWESIAWHRLNDYQAALAS